MALGFVLFQELVQPGDHFGLFEVEVGLFGGVLRKIVELAFGAFGLWWNLSGVAEAARAETFDQLPFPLANCKDTLGRMVDHRLVNGIFYFTMDQDWQ